MAEKNVQRVFVSILLALICVTAGIAYVFNRLGADIEHYMSQKFTEEQLLLARQVSSHIEDKFHSIENLLNVYDNVIELEGIPGRLAGGGGAAIDARARRSLETEVRHLLMQNPDYLRFAITDARGNPLFLMENVGGIIRAVPISPQRRGNGDFFPRGERLGREKTLISTPHEVKMSFGSTAARPMLIDISLPLIHGTKVVGRLFLSLDMEYIIDVLTGGKGTPSGPDHRWLFDSDGHLVHCSLVMSQEYHEEEIRFLVGKPSGTYELETHADKSRDLLSIVPLVIGDNRWILVAEASLEDVVGLVHDVRTVRSVMIFGLTLLAAGGGLLLYRNITRRMAAEEKGKLVDQLAAQEAKYRMLIELAPDPIFLLGADLRVMDVNTIALRTFGHHREGMVGARFEDYVDRKEEFRENVRLVNEGLSGKELVHTVVAGHGRTQFFENTTAIIKAVDGKVFYQTYLRNVTERVELEKRLRLEKENLDRIVGSMGAGLAIFNKDLKLEWYNERYHEFANRINAQLANDRCFVCTLAGAGECLVQACLNTGQTQKLERSFIIEGGQTAHYLVIATPHRELGGEKMAMEMIIDITESKNMEAQLLQSEKLASIGELASGIAHELNNPMAGIIGYSELLIDELQGQEVPKKDAERIHKEAVRCSKIIQNLLTFARRHKPEKGEISLNDVLENTVDIIEYEFKVNNVVIKKEYEPNLKMAMGDHYQMQQVFLNILNNGFYYLKDKPGARYIVISTHNTPRGVQAVIRNNGPKVDPAIIGKIFDPFFTTKEVGKGTGLGLSVSHGIILSHKGDLSVSNVDDGVAFTVSLPAIG